MGKRLYLLSLLFLTGLAFGQDWGSVEEQMTGGVSAFAAFLQMIIRLGLLLFALGVPIAVALKVYEYQKQKIEQERGNTLVAVFWGVGGAVAGFMIVFFIFFLLRQAGIDAIQLIGEALDIGGK